MIVPKNFRLHITQGRKHWSHQAPPLYMVYICKDENKFTKIVASNLYERMAITMGSKGSILVTGYQMSEMNRPESTNIPILSDNLDLECARYKISR